MMYLMVLLFPILMNYFSPVLIIMGSAEGVIAFSFFFWTVWTLSALYLGRAACGYLCPLGAIQEVKDRTVPKRLKRIRNLKWLKYVLSLGWVSAIIATAVLAGGYQTIDLLYNTESGVSIDQAFSWIVWAIIVALVLLPAAFTGKRGFCHYFCPWGVLNEMATRLRNLVPAPGLHLEVSPGRCQQCQSCNRVCPMSLNVNGMVQTGGMVNRECILCGSCVDTCPEQVIRYVWGRPR